MARKKLASVFRNGTKHGWYLYCRYQYISENGVVWTKWFRDHSGLICEEYDKELIDKAIKEAKKFSETVDKVTKLKHEFEAREIDAENDPLKEWVELAKKYEEIDKKKAEIEERRRIKREKKKQNI